MRLKNFVVGADISNNEISNCGVRDFVFGNSGKNGEGIYVGTSSTQVRVSGGKGTNKPRPAVSLLIPSSRHVTPEHHVLGQKPALHR